MRKATKGTPERGVHHTWAPGWGYKDLVRTKRKSWKFSTRLIYILQPNNFGLVLSYQKNMGVKWNSRVPNLIEQKFWGWGFKIFSWCISDSGGEQTLYSFPFFSMCFFYPIQWITDFSLCVYFVFSSSLSGHQKPFLLRPHRWSTIFGSKNAGQLSPVVLQPHVEQLQSDSGDWCDVGVVPNVSARGVVKKFVPSVILCTW